MTPIVSLNERKLRRLVREMQNRDVFALELPRHYTAAASNELGELYSELVDECLETLGAMTDDELVQLGREAAHWMFADLSPPLEPREPQLQLIASHYVAARAQGESTNFDSAIENSLETSVVLEEYPELLEHLDGDGLLVVGPDVKLTEGGVFYRNHVLHYHQLLRRNYSSRPNFDFLGPFAQFATGRASSVECRIAIDHRRLMHRDDYRRIIECDAWYGPPFNPDRVDDPGYVGLTVLGRNPHSLFGLANSIVFTDFFWAHDSGVKTFEVEECCASDYRFGRFHFERYVHSERDIREQRFRHLDGAVKVYDDVAHARRRESHLPDTKYATHKVKLWRIDGTIPLDDWVHLIVMFMKGNEMIVEYLNPEAFEEMFELRVRDTVAWRAQQDNRA